MRTRRPIGMNDVARPIEEDRLELLRQFQAKAGCMHSQRRAESIMVKLSAFLTYEEKERVGIAWSHHRDCREGRAELDAVCEDIARSWQGLPSGEQIL